MENKFAPILERIKLVKKNLKITNEDLAIKANLPKGTLGKILSGETKDPKITTIIALAKALNISVNFLAYGDELDIDKNFTQTECNLIKKYRTLDERGKKAVDDTLQREYEFANKVINEHSATIITEERQLYNCKQSNDIERELENYRKELQAEQKGQLALQNLGEKKNA